MLANGCFYSEISERLGCKDHYIGLRERRFQQERLISLDARYPGVERRRSSAQTEARISELTRREPTDGATHWNSYRLANEVGVSQSTVSRAWQKYLLRPPVGAATWLVMIRSLKRKLPTSAGCTSDRRRTPLYSASTRRAPSKRWIAWTRFFHFHPVRYHVRFFSSKGKSDINAAKAVKLKTHHKARSSTLTKNPNTEMPTATIEFKCIRINLKRTSTFEPDESHIDSLIEIDLKIGDERLRDLKVEVRQLNGTDFQTQPLEVGNVIGYNWPWNYEEFRELCGRYYRDVIGSCGMGLSISRGARNLIERIAIQLYRREEISLPYSAGKMMHVK